MARYEKGSTQNKPAAKSTSLTDADIEVLRVGTVTRIGSNVQIHEQDWDRIMQRLEAGKPSRVVFEATQHLGMSGEEKPRTKAAGAAS